MWIAKPVASLSQEEKSSWNSISGQMPLAQTLFWAQAIDSLAGKSFLIFNPKEKVGGIVFLSDQPGQYECVNGPFLDWDNTQSIPRQLATFAMAVSRLDKNFRSLILRPRWEGSEIEKRLKNLPIPAQSWSSAATLLIPILKNADLQLQALSPRLRRTLRQTWRQKIQTTCCPANFENLPSFVPALQEFSKSRGFVVPPLSWFITLCSTKEADFWIVTSQIELQSKTQILICQFGKKVYYLFGYDQRIPSTPASLSTAAQAHWSALLFCQELGVESYDLNGYLIDAPTHHPYYGVCQFKEQFSGTVIRYDVPEFVIQS